jgi:hypothetical protein
MKAYKIALSLCTRKLDLFPRHFQNSEDIDTRVDKFEGWIKEAIANHIPMSKPLPLSVPWWSSELTQLLRNVSMARREHRR